MAEPQNPVKTTGLAMNGQPLLTDDLIKPSRPLPSPGGVVKISRNAEPVPPAVDIDYTDFKRLNDELVVLRNKFYLIRKDLSEAERAVVRTKWAYEGAKKRYMIQISGGTEKTRESAAELLAEAEYGDWLVAQQVAKEIATYHRDLKAELDLLKDLGNNLRRLMADV